MKCSRSTSYMVEISLADIAVAALAPVHDPDQGAAHVQGALVDLARDLHLHTLALAVHRQRRRKMVPSRSRDHARGANLMMTVLLVALPLQLEMAMVKLICDHAVQLLRMMIE
ncbi:hypothetical protein OESDEN_10733 [Oesophagostomum dentatum]|uniref:Uncharacterized protein n=1 Tax=Oesophagostomum dentatum TaxID=61180 RepID=A0A0B1SZU0_OESDE|nr:hypothetical protein OESDEN_10733 [Oesophagostomum dentatum]